MLSVLRVGDLGGFSGYHMWNWQKSICWVGISNGRDNMRRGMATDPSDFIGGRFRAILKGGAVDHFEAMATPTAMKNDPFTICED